jgi:hypothetical protein
MKSKMLIMPALLVAAIAILQLDGCSVIGLTAGAISDASKPDTITVPGWEMELIEAGRPIKVILKDRNWIEGAFAGIVRVPEEEYAKRYDAFRKEKKGELLLPELGEKIFITLESGAEGEREFLGFDYYYPTAKEEAKAISTSGIPNHVVYTKSIGDTATGIVTVSGIHRITDQNGNELKGEDLRVLISEGHIPLSSAIAVKNLADTTRVAMDQVYQIDVKAKKTGAKTGFIAGACIDLIVIAIAASSGDSEPKRTSDETGDIMCGCPFIYSYNGKDYILDSEGFGGSIFEAAKRTDLGRLDHLQEVNSTCRLKIVDQLHETDYIDEVKLLVVDHPQGTEVTPSFSGRLHISSDLQLPVKATDFQGNDVLDQVKEKDEHIWVSNPFGRNPNYKAHARDGLILEFPRSKGTTFVKLAFNVQNTLWAAHLQSHFLELHGNQLDNWYHLLNTSSQVREEFQKLMVREGMLLVKLWNGNDWQTFDFVWEVGASVFRDQVIWLDISQIPGEVLKVRLECPSGFWMINSVRADYSPDLPLKTTEITPITAEDHLGNNLLQVLQTTDSQYHVMYRGDWAKLSFKVPPRQEGFKRSYMVKSSGYYRINVAAEGEPEVELIEQFMTEPFAFGQYSLKLLNGYVTTALARSEQK